MRWALIDCENLTSPRHLGWAARWRHFERVELFGRAWAVARWRATFRRLRAPPTAEAVIPDDAPPQAADAAIQARLVEIAERRPSLIVIASNDSDFTPDIERLTRRGIAVEWARDVRSPAEAIRLAMAELGRDGTAQAAAVGELLWRRYGIRAKGRLRGWAAQAGAEVVGEVITMRRKREPA